MNSKKLEERIKMYQDDGWIVDINKMERRKSNQTCGLTPDGEYDVWYPLPPTASISISDHDQKVQRVLKLNAAIAAGSIYSTMPCGDCPSAWIDYEGHERNKALYAQAIEQVKKELSSGKQLYIRQGARFVKL
jgi:hypothetical protein